MAYLIGFLGFYLLLMFTSKVKQRFIGHRLDSLILLVFSAHVMAVHLMENRGNLKLQVMYGLFYSLVVPLVAEREKSYS